MTVEEKSERYIKNGWWKLNAGGWKARMKEAFVAGHAEAIRWRRNVDINERAYRELIDQNIEELNKYMPESSLERRHIIDIMEHSIFLYYGDLSTVKISDK